MDKVVPFTEEEVKHMLEQARIESVLTVPRIDLNNLLPENLKIQNDKDDPNADQAVAAVATEIFPHDEEQTDLDIYKEEKHLKVDSAIGEGRYGSVKSYNFFNSGDLIAVKKGKVENLEVFKHELFMGMIIARQMRLSGIPNFIPTYTGFISETFDSASPNPFDEEPTLTKDTYTVMKRVAGTKEVRQSYLDWEDLLSILLQCLYAMKAAAGVSVKIQGQRKIIKHFYHGDFHIANVLIKKLDDYKVFTYKLPEKTVHVKSRYVAYMIDFGFSYVEFTDGTYFGPVSYDPIFPHRPAGPGRDIIKFITTASFLSVRGVGDQNPFELICKDLFGEKYYSNKGIIPNDSVYNGYNIEDLFGSMTDFGLTPENVLIDNPEAYYPYVFPRGEVAEIFKKLKSFGMHMEEEEKESKTLLEYANMEFVPKAMIEQDLNFAPETIATIHQIREKIPVLSEEIMVTESFSMSVIKKYLRIKSQVKVIRDCYEVLKAKLPNIVIGEILQLRESFKRLRSMAVEYVESHGEDKQTLEIKMML